MLLSSIVGIALAQNGPPPVVLAPESEPAEIPPGLDREATGFGLGILLGVPTGFSFAWRPETGRAWYDGAVAWSFDRGTFDVHADVLLTLADLRTEEIPDVRFPVWIGVGPRFRLGDSPFTVEDEIVALGVRVPVGMSFIHDGLPFEAFLELAPGIGLYPSTRAFFDVALGGRFYFPPKAE